MNLFSLFTFSVLAAEAIVSPLPDNRTPPTITGIKPEISFGRLTAFPQTPSVLGVATEAASTPAATPTPSPTETPRLTRKSTYTIAVLGDSMVDTLGPELPHLGSRLRELYPRATFNLLNYGVGATNIDYGIERLTNGYTYLGKQVSSLVSQQPDIVVIESFGYNPYATEGNSLDRHWLALARAVDIIHANLPSSKIVIGATIAPNANVFGDGAAGLSFDPLAKQQHVAVIKQYLENATRFAQSQHLPLADAYHPSLDSTGNGRLAYINPGDHVHYSDAGRALFSGKIATAIVNNHLLE